MSFEQLLAWIGLDRRRRRWRVRSISIGFPHVAIIMDGNGRWAAQRHLPRVEEHRAGIDSVRDAVETSARLGIDVLTLYVLGRSGSGRVRKSTRSCCC